MPRNRESGIKARDTNKAKYGADFYKKIGAKGGAKSRTGGFYYLRENDPERLKEIGRKGGRIGGLVSRRGKHLKVTNTMLSSDTIVVKKYRG